MAWYNKNGVNAGYSRSRWQQDYDAYMKRIEQYKGTAFYNQLANNPYYQYQAYDGNVFQQLWSDFTGNTNFIDNFYNDRKTSGDEYMSQILNAMHTESYNDPAAEVARRRAAGINDTLNGGESIGSGEAGQVVPDETPPSAPTDNTFECISQVSQMGMNLFQSWLSMQTFLQDMVGKKLENSAKDIMLTDTGLDSMIKMMAGSSSLPTSREEYDKLTEEAKTGLDDQLIQELDEVIRRGDLKNMYSTRAARKLMKSLRGTVMHDENGRPTLAYEAYRSKLLSERYGSHKEAAGVIGTPGFSENILEFGKNIADTFGKIDLALRSAQQKLAEANSRKALSEATATEQYNGTVVDGLSPAQASAKAAIAGSEAQVSASENMKIIEDMRKSINDEFAKLQEIANSKGGLEGMLLRLLIPYARSRTEQIIQQGFGAAIVNSSGLGSAISPATGALLK